MPSILNHALQFAKALTFLMMPIMQCCTVEFVAFPSNLSVALDSLTPPTVRVTWKHEFELKPLKEDTIRAVAAQRFELSYRAIDERFRLVLELPRQARTARLDRLRPGTEYELYLSAVSSGGIHNDSGVIHFIAPISKENQNLSNVQTIQEKAIVSVREEEIIIIAIVLIVWVAVILLFFNKWGKIRMLEPYQPQYVEESAAFVGPLNNPNPKEPRVSVSDPLSTHHHIFDRDISRATSPSFNRGHHHRQNSVFVDNSFNKECLMHEAGMPRKFKSAEDLKSLVVHITHCDVETSVL